MTDVLFGLAAFFISIPWNFQYAIPNTKRTINVLNYIDTQYLGTQGVFAAILISGCAVWLYNKLMQRNFTIKLPAIFNISEPITFGLPIVLNQFTSFHL